MFARNETEVIEAIVITKYAGWEIMSGASDDLKVKVNNAMPNAHSVNMKYHLQYGKSVQMFAEIHHSKELKIIRIVAPELLMPIIMVRQQYKEECKVPDSHVIKDDMDIE